MIETIAFEGLRGVERPVELALAPLTVLVGSNGAGKSVVLDEVLIGASESPGAALARAVARHRGPPDGAAWLCTGGQRSGRARISAKLSGASERVHLRLQVVEASRTGGAARTRSGGLQPAWLAKVTAEEPPVQRGSEVEPTTLVAEVAFDRTNAFDVVRRTRNGDELAGPFPWRHARPPLFLVGANTSVGQVPDHELNARAVTTGRRDSVVEWLRPLVPDLRNIELLENDVLGLVFRTKQAHPLQLAGDGVASAARLGLFLSIASGGTTLIEHPEIGLGPSGLRLVAAMLGVAVEEGVQVVVTTHSLELLDGLLEEARQRGLPLLVCHLKLTGGELRSTPFDLGEALSVRETFLEDLR